MCCLRDEIWVAIHSVAGTRSLGKTGHKITVRTLQGCSVEKMINNSNIHVHVQ